ncbi:MAG: hypothetical protein OXH99_13020 [Bryobacterales bacterium]|nr:hypothetical protein [Bryobacterales bacterium]
MIAYLGSRQSELDQKQNRRIAEAISSWQPLPDLVATILGIDWSSVCAILAETGP